MPLRPMYVGVSVMLATPLVVSMTERIAPVSLPVEIEPALVELVSDENVLSRMIGKFELNAGSVVAPSLVETLTVGKGEFGSVSVVEVLSAMYDWLATGLAP